MEVCSPALIEALRADDPWAETLAQIVRGDAVVDTVFQPIVDLKRGCVAGYESLSRIPAPFKASPDKWFQKAELFGCSDELEYTAVSSALAARETLPSNTFLTINVGPDFLLSHHWQEMISTQGDLSRLVVEVTENRPIADYDAMRKVIAQVRAMGGSFAVDDAGSGYASLQLVMALRPDFVKLDRAFIVNCHQDPAKSAIIEMIGTFAGRVDAWVIAEGIETSEELDELIRLNTPLAQGFLLGRPSPTWSQVEADISLRILSHSISSMERTGVGWALDPVHAASSLPRAAWRFEEDPSQTAIPLIDGNGRPTSLVLRDPHGGTRLVGQLMKVKASTPLNDVLYRASTRPITTRFDPPVVVNEDGTYAGLLPLDRLIRAALTGASPQRDRG